MYKNRGKLFYCITNEENSEQGGQNKW